MGNFKRFVKYLWRTWEIYQLAVVLGSAGMITFVIRATSNTVQDTPLGWQILLYISITLLLLVCIRMITPLICKRFHTEKPGQTTSQGTQLEFYEDLTNMRQTRGGMEKELEEYTISSAWVAWQTGYYFRTMVNNPAAS